jgi:hypothetical protein
MNDKRLRQISGTASTTISILAAGFLFISSAYASSGTEGASFLDIPVGAGPAAMGSAYAASARDAYAPIYNPAGLGFVAGPEVAAQQLFYLDSINYESGSFVIPVGHSTTADLSTGKAVGASIQYLGTGSITETDPIGNTQGHFSAYYSALSLSYGQKVLDKLDKLSVGITGKVIHSTLADVSANAYAADLGTLYQFNERLAFAATLANVGSKLTYSSQNDSLPLSGHLGTAYQIKKFWKMTAEGVYSQSGLLSGRFGTEWSPLEAVSLRAGYKTETLENLSAIAGLTLGLGLHAFGQEFAYAWLPYGDLGNTQYFSLLLRFGQEARERRNLIRYNAIKKHQSVHGNYDERQPTHLEPDQEQLMQLMNNDDHSHTAQVSPGPSSQ